MSEDKCRPVEVDGEIIRVLGGAEMDATDREMFAEIVRAAKRRMAAEAPRDRGQCPVCAESVALRADGDIRAHGGTGLLHRCPGSWEPPEDGRP